MNHLFNKNPALYSVEGAFTIVIFTALFMMLISLISVIQVECEVADALNEVAMQLSQVSYAVLSGDDGNNEETTKLRTVLKATERDVVGFTSGNVLCNTLVTPKIDRKIMNQIDGGKINYSASNTLGDGRTISLVAIYDIKVETFGLVDKRLHICQRAETLAWLPYNVSILNPDYETKSSIWDETNFTRGKYFVTQVKGSTPVCEVESGQGFDLYYRDEGKVVEIVSLNVFSPSYSYCNGKKNDPQSYSPNSENIEKQLDKIIAAYKKDIKQSKNDILMADGSYAPLLIEEKELILILPNEAQTDAFSSYFENLIGKYANEGFKVQIQYSEDAL